MAFIFSHKKKKKPRQGYYREPFLFLFVASFYLISSGRFFFFRRSRWMCSLVCEMGIARVSLFLLSSARKVDGIVFCPRSFFFEIIYAPSKILTQFITRRRRNITGSGATFRTHGAAKL